MSNDFLQLTIPYKEFAKKYEEFKSRLKELLIYQPTNVGNYITELDELNKEIFLFLQQSFNISANRFLIDFRNASSNEFQIGSFAKLEINGLKYAQSLKAEAFGLYKMGYELSVKEQELYKASFEKVKREIIVEMKEEFNNQQEFLKIALDNLYQLVDESLELINSKLPEKSIKEGIVGKIISKAQNKGIDLVMKMVWDKMMQDPQILSWFSDTLKTFKLH